MPMPMGQTGNLEPVSAYAILSSWIINVLDRQLPRQASAYPSEDWGTEEVEHCMVDHADQSLLPMVRICKLEPTQDRLVGTE